MRGLYIHIPFCKSICSYCDFTKSVSNINNQIKYIDYLIKEIDNKKSILNNINTVYIGGGTPNAIPLNLLDKLLNKIDIYLNNSIENSIELNPELINQELIDILKKHNINRISLGVESFNDKSLKILNRSHNEEIIKNTINLLKKNNLNNINIDLIFGIPNTTIDDVKYDLNQALKLDIKHISYYNLILEDKTILKYKIDKKELKLIDDDLLRDMYDYINNTLNDNGFNHYEISNYAKIGYESKHNLIYWNLDEYIGIGLSAAGLVNNIRYYNTNTFNGYYNNYNHEEIKLSINDIKTEFMIMGLRKIEGINLEKYNKLFNSTPINDFKINDLIKNNILIIKNNYLKINENYLFVSNSILERFI